MRSNLNPGRKGQVLESNSKPVLIAGAHRLVILTALLLLFTVGCALNPYVSTDYPVKYDGTVDTSLDAARKYANDMQEAYRTELGKQATLQNSLGGGLIATGATILGLAAYGAHTDAILGVGLASGTGFALGQWYINDPRQRAYLEGIKGIHCAKAAILAIDISEADMDRFKRDLEKLADLIFKVSQDIGTVEAVLPRVEIKGLGTSKLTVMARSNVEKAKTHMENASQVLASGASLMRLTNSAGARLMNSVEKISIEVDLAIQKSSPTLSAIPNIVQGLSDSTSIFVPGLNLMGDLTAAFASSDQEKDDVKQESTAGAIKDQDTATGRLIDAMAGLNTSTRDMTTATQQVHGFIQEVKKAKPVETLANCGVELPEAILNISLTPSALTFMVQKASEKIILVEGGTKPYAARLLDTTEKGLTVQSPIPGETVVRVSVSEETAPGGPYQLLIMDATMSHKKIVPITIQAQPNDQEEDITTWKLEKEEDIKIVQRKLCTKEDGKIGDDTKLAIRIFQETIKAKKSDSELTEDQFNTLKKITDCKEACPKCLNYFEKDLGPDEIAILRDNLGLDPGDAPGTIEEDMRKKIKQLPDSKDPEASKRGQLTKALQEQINKNGS